HAPSLFMGAEQRQHGRRVVARPHLGVIRINGGIAAVVNVRLEIFLAPAVEGVGEQEAAGGAAPVAHERAGWRQPDAAVDLAIPVEVDGPVDRRGFAADLAGDQRRRNRRQTQHASLSAAAAASQAIPDLTPQMRTVSFPLVPAKAGTQGKYFKPRIAPWIPAFAGMSGVIWRAPERARLVCALPTFHNRSKTKKTTNVGWLLSGRSAP